MSAQRGRYIPWIFAGLMGVVVAVNGVLVTAALGTHTGTTTGQAFDRGLHYGQALEEAARQRALGWQAEVIATPGGLLLRGRDREGTPLPASLTVQARLQRRLERGALPLDFAPSGPGLWRAAVAPAPGQWEAVVVLAAGHDRLELHQRLVLP